MGCQERAMCSSRAARNDLGRWAPWLLAIVVLGVGFIYYSHRLVKWLAYDDEGGYLYAAWRIASGEMPYLDFWTPQLPLFLYPGALVLKLSGNSVLAARLSMTALTLGSAYLLFLTVRHAWGARTGLIALGLLLGSRDFFWAGRFFRPEAPMLFWGALGLYLFATGYPERHRGRLVLAGVMLSLSAMSKLFGALTMAGVGLFVFVDGWRTHDWSAMRRVGSQVGLPFLLVAAGITGLFQMLAPDFLALVLGHHLRQGSGTPFGTVVGKALMLYWDFVRVQPVYATLAAVGLLFSTRARHRMGLVFICQVPTALAFLLMTRDVQERHLTYLVPSIAAGAALGLESIWRLVARPSSWARTLAATVLVTLGIALALRPHWTQNAWVSSWEEHDTEEWVRYIQSHTSSDDVVMSDYPGLNFFAQRRTTPIAAGISRGAALSGQIMGSALIQEIEAYDVRMVLLNVAQGAHQFVHLRDYPAFKRYVQNRFVLADRKRYDYRLMEIYGRDDLWPGDTLAVSFDHALILTGQEWLVDSAAPGENLQVALRWQGIADIQTDYVLTLRVFDRQGHIWGLGSKQLVDLDKDTYWDDKGLERPVLLPTSQWPLDETTIEVFEVPIDLATPPGAYSVRVRVHPEGSWNGLSYLDARGGPAGQDFDLGQVFVGNALGTPDVSMLPMDSHVGIDLLPDLRLVGYSLSQRELRPGDRFTLSVIWSALAEMSRDQQLELTLQRGGDIWARTLVSPAAGYGTSLWHAGEVLRGQYDLVVDAEMPPGEYAVRAALLDSSPGTEALVLDRVVVSGRQRLFEAPSHAHESGARFGNQVTLIGYDIASEGVKGGDALPLALVWRADGRMDESYTVFVHLIDDQSKVWGQQDNPPMNGTYPTLGWVPGEFVVDEYAVLVQQDAPAGNYSIEVGLYSADTGRRLPCVDANGTELDGDRVILGGIEIAPD